MSNFPTYVVKNLTIKTNVFLAGIIHLTFSLSKSSNMFSPSYSSSLYYFYGVKIVNNFAYFLLVLSFGLTTT